MDSFQRGLMTLHCRSYVVPYFLRLSHQRHLLGSDSSFLSHISPLSTSVLSFRHGPVRYTAHGLSLHTPTRAPVHYEFPLPFRRNFRTDGGVGVPLQRQRNPVQGVFVSDSAPTPLITPRTTIILLPPFAGPRPLCPP